MLIPSHITLGVKFQHKNRGRHEHSLCDTMLMGKQIRIRFVFLKELSGGILKEGLEDSQEEERNKGHLFLRQELRTVNIMGVM